MTRILIHIALTSWRRTPSSGIMGSRSPKHSRALATYWRERVAAGAKVILWRVVSPFSHPDNVVTVLRLWLVTKRSMDVARVVTRGMAVVLSWVSCPRWSCQGVASGGIQTTCEGLTHWTVARRWHCKRHLLLSLGTVKAQIWRRCSIGQMAAAAIARATGPAMLGVG